MTNEEKTDTLGAEQVLSADETHPKKSNEERSNSPSETHPKTPSDPQPKKGDEVSTLRAKVSEYEDILKRLQAEFDNYRKRVAKEKAQAHLDGQVSALKHFLSFQDEMEAAMAHLSKSGGAPGKGDAATHASSSELHKGVGLLNRKLASILNGIGVQEIGCTVVDPNLHEVMMRVPGGEEGHIAQVLRKGYVLGDHVLRHAQVSVYSGEEVSEEKKENISTKKEGE